MLVLLAHKATQDHKDLQVQLVHKDLLVQIQLFLDLLALLALLVHKVNKDLSEQQVLLALQALLVQQDQKAIQVQQPH
jgi:hypothetical protein